MSHKRSTTATTSKFSSYLKNLFEESGESVASVARSIGVERTSIHKALSGDRILPYHVAHALADHFQLSLEEQQEYFRLYNILLQGEDVWQNRTAVASLLNYLSTMQFQAITASAAAAVTPPMCGNTPFKGEFAVRDIVNTVLYYEIQQNDHPTFQLFLPPDMDLSQIFISQWLDGKQFDVEQLFSISTINSDNCAKNVQLLRQIIPLSLISRDSYRPYHFHENAGSSFISPLNYYIITPHYLILLRQDQTVAYVQESEYLIDVYSEHFRSLTEHCEPLVFCAANLSEVLSRSNSMIDLKGNLYLTSQPCFGHYYTSEIISKYFQVQNCPIPGIFEESVKHFSLLQKTEKNFCTVFSEKGLQYFIETGIVTEMPAQYIPPADVKDRLYLLSRLRDDIAEEKVTGLIARPSSLRLPEYLTLTVDSDGNAYFDTTSDFPFGACYCNIHISEKSICQVFKDFFASLQGSQMVYSREDTLRMLDEGIQRLNNKDSSQG
ncbi:MAG: helix-turn-helix domain-containing protein [Lachnospiraceae bacterium]|nr:helix-turn-helix domain-containing protein [Lachnospiraceae bacterium]